MDGLIYLTLCILRRKSQKYCGVSSVKHGDSKLMTRMGSQYMEKAHVRIQTEVKEHGFCRVSVLILYNEALILELFHPNSF